MDWISTPFVLILFSGLVFFAVSCVFCFMLGRLFGKLDGHDSPGEGRRTGNRDRRGPQRTHAGDRGNTPAVREAPESDEPLTDAPAFKHRSAG